MGAIYRPSFFTVFPVLLFLTFHFKESYITTSLDDLSILMFLYWLLEILKVLIFFFFLLKDDTKLNLLKCTNKDEMREMNKRYNNNTM